MSVLIRPAKKNDLENLSELLERLELPLAGVQEHFSNFLVAEKNRRVIGAVGLEIYENVGLLRSLAVEPTEQVLELKTSKLYGLASTMQDVVCHLGLGDLGGEIDLCTLTVEQMADAFLPTLKFYMPYQPVDVPTPQAFTTYYWRFRTDNGAYQSGWTGWSSFYRPF